jgi:hypothetical protein
MIKLAGWKWWMRFKRPIAEFADNGCFNDACENPDDKCKCNNWGAARLPYEAAGYTVRGIRFPIWGSTGLGIKYLSDGNSVVRCYYNYGR